MPAMNTSARRPPDREPREDDGHSGHNDSAAGMMAMMVLMMSMCLGMVVLFAVIPALGLPLGLAIAAAGAAVMLFLHGRIMRHDGD
jgi:hypothetical protein